jgi:hypothetical protein
MTRRIKVIISFNGYNNNRTIKTEIDFTRRGESVSSGLSILYDMMQAEEEVSRSRNSPRSILISCAIHVEEQPVAQ